MTVEDGGHQPVVVMKQGNACGAKGHRQDKFIRKINLILYKLTSLWKP